MTRSPVGFHPDVGTMCEIALERIIRLLLSDQCVREAVNIPRVSYRYHIILCYYNNNDNNNSILLRFTRRLPNFQPSYFLFNIFSRFCFFKRKIS